MMESAEENHGLLRKILPPRLEDAGLEDCALPPESIHQAFLKAASTVKSRAAAIFHDDDEDEDVGGCINDSWPEGARDVVIGNEKEEESPASCGAAVKGGGNDSDEVKVIGGGVEEVGDRVVVGEGEDKLKEGEKPCVDALQGLEIEEKEKKNKNKNKNKKNGDDEEKEKKPTLVGGYV